MLDGWALEEPALGRLLWNHFESARMMSYRCAPVPGLRRQFLEASGVSYQYSGRTIDIASGIIDDTTRIILRNASLVERENGPFKFSLKSVNSRCGARPLHENDDFEFVFVMIPPVSERQYSRGMFVFPKSFLAEEGMLTTSERCGVTTMYCVPPWVGNVTSSQKSRRDRQASYFVSDAAEFQRLWTRLNEVLPDRRDGTQCIVATES